MSWLSQGLSDIGLNSVNNAFNSQPGWLKDVEGAVPVALASIATAGAIDPALFAAAPAAIGADVAASAPLDLSAIAAGGAGADIAAGAPLDILAAGGIDTAAGATDLGTPALGFASDVTGNTIPGFLTLASDSALAGNVTPVAGLTDVGSSAAPSLSAATTVAAPDATSGSLADLNPDTLNFLQNAGVNPDIATQALNAQAQPQGFLSAFQQNFNPASLGTTAGKALANPLTDLGIAGLGYNLYAGYQQNQALKALQQQQAGAAATEQSIASQEQSAATPLINQGTALTQYLTTNTLPPQYQSMVTQQVQAAKAAIIQGYASRGQNANPQQNSALQQDLNNVDQQAETMQANLEQQLAQAGTSMVTTANQLLQSGASATEISAQLPIQIAKLNAELNATTASAISNFAAAMNGGTNLKNVTLNIPQNPIA